MAGTLDRRRGGMIVGINVTPLVDVVLVLLVVFMITSTMIVVQSIKVDLPKAASSDGPASTPAKLTITSGGTLLWNDRPVTTEGLGSILSEALASQPTMELVISADQTVDYGVVVRYIDMAKVAGITRFAINVESAE